MEEATKATLRQLKETCLRGTGRVGEKTDHYSYYDEVGTMVTISTLALQGLAKEEEGVRVSHGADNDALRSIVESVILEGLEEIASRETGSDVDPYTGRFVDDLWSHCLQLVQFPPDILDAHTPSTSLEKSISSMCLFSLQSNRLLHSFLSVSKAVLAERQLLSLLSRLHDGFWSREAIRLAQLATSTVTTDVQNVSMETGNSLERLVKLLAAVHCFLSIHNTVATSLSDHRSKDGENEEGGSGRRVKNKLLSSHHSRVVNLWLCPGTLGPLLDSLATSAPKLLWSVYKSAVEVDMAALGRGADMAAVPYQLKMVDLLISALSCLIQLSEEVNLSPLPKKDAPLIITFVVTETTLRLVNQSWNELTKIIKRVPRELPVKVLYLALSSFVRLHSFLADCHLVFNDEQKETHSRLLRTFSESCDSLREHIISYHSQLCLTSLLHDASSQNWNSTKPFFEGERSSYCIQMYCYHVKGLKHDLCTLVAPWSYDLAEKILLSVMSSTLSHLARRYSSTTPSHARVNQFRVDILSILATVLSLLPQLRNEANPLHNDQLSPEKTLIHRSCNQLLTVLAVGACPLTDLEEVLSQLNVPLLPPATDKRERAGMKDSEHKDLLCQAVVDCSCRWVSILEHHLPTLAGTHVGVGTSLYGHELNARSQVAAASLSFPCCISHGNGRGGRQIDTQRSSTPPNVVSAALLQSLLVDHTSLAVQLCKSSVASESLVVDITSLFSLCSHDEWALTCFYKDLCNARGISSGSQSQERNSKQEEAFYNWLCQQLQINLERYVLSMSAGLHGNLHDRVKVWQHILSSLNSLGERLSSLDLPISILNLIWTMADDISERDVCSKGDSLAKLLAFLVSRWSILAHHRLEGPLGASLSAHLYSITYALGGVKPAQDLPQPVEQVINSHQTELQSWLNKFDRFLPRPVGGCDQREEPTLTECEVAWEVIKEDDVMVTSFKRVHSALVRWWYGSNTVSSKEFDPQGEHNNAPTMEMVDSIDWKVLVGGVIEGGATPPTICNILETVRWEFQDGASRSLEEREAELIKAVWSYLHYNDDCTV